MLPRVFAALFVLLALPFSGAAQTNVPPAEVGLRPGDRVTVELYTSAGEEIGVVGGERTIDNAGNIFLPFVGTVAMAGSNAAELRARLAERYAEFYSDPVVDLRVEVRISITGAVANQGQYYVDPTTTVAQALTLAGGMSAEVAVNSLILPADQRRVRVVRDGRTVILNLSPDDITEAALAVRVQSGDYIHVPPRSRSQLRDQITFWGGVLSFLTSIVSLIILANR